LSDIAGHALLLDETVPPIDAMERLRRRLAELVDERTTAGKLRQKRLAEYFTRADGTPRSEAWISNIIKGQRGFRLVDLDRLAEFFHLPPSEFIREFDSALVEVTPTEMGLLRKFRRLTPNKRAALLEMTDVDEEGKAPTQKRTAKGVKKSTRSNNGRA
jgi:transcriptional regulator with XRE-family HTH domain